MIWPLKGGSGAKCSLSYRPLHHDDMMRKGGGVSSNIYLVHFVVIYFVSNLLLFEYWRQNIVNYDGPFAAQLNLYNL